MSKTVRELSTEELVLFAHELREELNRRVQALVPLADFNSTINKLTAVLEEDDKIADTSKEKIRGC